MNSQDFLIGVNYWASHAGADMWRNWDENVVERDLQFLSAYGVRVLRVFPNWRDFQPVEPMFRASHELRTYCMKDDAAPDNAYYLDEDMLNRFETLCRIAEKYHIKLIVGLITGWMSGRLYIPVALNGENLFTSSVALYFEQLFLRGFVSRFRSMHSILAWDLGNECNCMDVASSREAAYSWTSMVVNAIKAVDPTRPVVSGMHSLELNGVWNIQDQGALTDILTTHPYPYWVEHCQKTPLTHFRTLLHATAQTQYYHTVGHKPCLVEELGSMGPMNLSEERAADFLGINLWSSWVHGAPGVLWWCGFDQRHLEAPPYEWNMCERELGMAHADYTPKPTLLKMKEFAEQVKQLNVDLPPAEIDSVCLLSWKQDHWGVAYMSYLLAKQAGCNMAFSSVDQLLPDSALYFLPSIHLDCMGRKNYFALKEKVRQGATLYISSADGILTEFEELTGLKVLTAEKMGWSAAIRFQGCNLELASPHKRVLLPTRAKVLAADDQGNPAFTVAEYGKGKVYYLNFPMEEMLLEQASGVEKGYERLYQQVAKEVLQMHPVQKSNPWVGLTVHKGQKAIYAVLLNYSGEWQDAGVRFSLDSRPWEKVWGDAQHLGPYGIAILKCATDRE